MYNTDWLKWVVLNTWYDLRVATFTQWVHALIKPVRSIDSGVFPELRAAVYEQYRWNGSKNSILKLLNNRYDPILRRIKLELVPKTPVLFYKGGNEQQDAFYTSGAVVEEYFFRDIDTVNTATDLPYEVKVLFWETTTFNPQLVLELLDTYRLAGIRPALFSYNLDTEIELNILRIENE
jgi:hypothetical protein